MFSPSQVHTGPSPYTVPAARSPSSCSSSLFLHLPNRPVRMLSVECKAAHWLRHAETWSVYFRLWKTLCVRIYLYFSRLSNKKSICVFALFSLFCTCKYVTQYSACIGHSVPSFLNAWLSGAIISHLNLRCKLQKSQIRIWNLNLHFNLCTELLKSGCTIV